jgi:hypothetical protein
MYSATESRDGMGSRLALVVLVEAAQMTRRPSRPGPRTPAHLRAQELHLVDAHHVRVRAQPLEDSSARSMATDSSFCEAW